MINCRWSSKATTQSKRRASLAFDSRSNTMKRIGINERRLASDNACFWQCPAIILVIVLHNERNNCTKVEPTKRQILQEFCSLSVDHLQFTTVLGKADLFLAERLRFWRYRMRRKASSLRLANRNPVGQIPQDQRMRAGSRGRHLEWILANWKHAPSHCWQSQPIASPIADPARRQLARVRLATRLPGPCQLELAEDECRASHGLTFGFAAPLAFNGKVHLKNGNCSDCLTVLTRQRSTKLQRKMRSTPTTGAPAPTESPFWSVSLQKVLHAELQVCAAWCQSSQTMASMKGDRKCAKYIWKWK